MSNIFTMGIGRGVGLEGFEQTPLLQEIVLPHNGPNPYFAKPDFANVMYIVMEHF